MSRATFTATARIAAAIRVELADQRAVGLADVVVGRRDVEAEHDIKVCVRIKLDGHGS